MSSDCSSGCQSGWTMYLVPSSDENDSFYYYNVGGAGFGPDRDQQEVEEEEEEEEEGQSMISDASSGPRFCYSGALIQHAPALAPDDAADQRRSSRRTTMKSKRPDVEQRQRRSSALDDTASSQLFSNSKDSFDDCNYCLKQQQRQRRQSAEVGFSASHVEEQIGYSCVKPTPSRPVARKKEGKAL